MCSLKSFNKKKKLKFLKTLDVIQFSWYTSKLIAQLGHMDLK